MGKGNPPSGIENHPQKCYVAAEERWWHTRSGMRRAKIATVHQRANTAGHEASFRRSFVKRSFALLRYTKEEFLSR